VVLHQRALLFFCFGLHNASNSLYLSVQQQERGAGEKMSHAGDKSGVLLCKSPHKRGIPTQFLCQDKAVVVGQRVTFTVRTANTLVG
jgi:hypothetical protein